MANKYIPQAHKQARALIIEEIVAQGYDPKRFKTEDIDKTADHLLLNLLDNNPISSLVNNLVSS